MAAPAGWPRTAAEWQARQFWLWNAPQVGNTDDALREGTLDGPLSWSTVLHNVLTNEGACIRSLLWPDGMSREAALPLRTAIRSCEAAVNRG